MLQKVKHRQIVLLSNYRLPPPDERPPPDEPPLLPPDEPEERVGLVGV